MTKEKIELWLTSIDLWRSGAVVTDFMRAELAGLRDAAGDPLPEPVRQFLDDLVFCRSKPRKGRPVAKRAIRASYAARLFLNQADGAPSPSERAIQAIAQELKMSEGLISLIVHPRKARQA